MKSLNKKILIIVLILLFIAFFIFQCNPGNEQIFDKTPPADITELTATASDETIILSWIDPTDEDFMTVRINYEPGEDTPMKIKKGVQEAVFTELSNGVVYTFTVKTEDLNNVSSGETVSAIPKDNTIPPAPTNFEAVGGEIVATVNWTNIKPEDNDLSHIEIIYNDGSTNSDPIIIESTKNKSTLTLIQPIEYTITAKAVDTSGNKSEEVSTTVTPTNDKAPAAPTDISVIDTGSNTATINWTDPSAADLDRIVISYTDKDSNSKTMEIDKGVETADISNIDSTTEYSIKSVDIVEKESITVIVQQ
ncbi:MAG: fibronectin type III domain-containing protein [Spirochaetota bacterium]